MFKGPFIASVFAFAAVAILCGWVFSTMTAADRISYHELIARSDSAKTSQHAAPCRTQQQRFNVSKQLLHTSDGERQQLSLRSTASELVFVQNQDKTELVERLRDVHGYKEQCVAGQEPRHYELEAESAVYHYNSEELEADKVHIRAPLSTDEPLEASSKAVTYKGRELSLSGDVHLDHPLGAVTAHQVVFTPAAELKGGTKSPIVQLSEDVKVNLKDGGQLFCQEAYLDGAMLTGLFQGNDREPDVIYLGQEKSASNEVLPFSVKGKQMEVALKRDTNGTHLNTIRVEQEVRVDYHEDTFVSGDRAIYDRSNNAIHLEASTSKGCQLSNRQGDKIDADSISIDLASREIVFTAPNGELKDSEKGVRGMRFSADRLVWNEKAQELLLSGKVSIEGPTGGFLSTDNDVKVFMKAINGKKAISTIVATAETELRHVDDIKGITHQLLCHGPLTVDHEQLKIGMESPVDSLGKVFESQQVVFEDPMGEVYADSMEIAYAFNDKGFVPTKLTMNGDVKILNRFDGHIEESGALLQYALADHVEYLPTTKEMLLSSEIRGHRVLLYDKVNRLQMSAPALKIKRDTHSKKDSVQGIGDVRFNFLESELEQLKQQFKERKGL